MGEASNHVSQSAQASPVFYRERLKAISNRLQVDIPLRLGSISIPFGDHRETEMSSFGMSRKGKGKGWHARYSFGIFHTKANISVLLRLRKRKTIKQKALWQILGSCKLLDVSDH